MRMTRFRRNLDARVLVGEGPKSTPTQSLLNAMRFDCFAPKAAIRRIEIKPSSSQLRAALVTAFIRPGWATRSLATSCSVSIWASRFGAGCGCVTAASARCCRWAEKKPSRRLTRPAF